MQQITMKKAELLKIVKENRDKHREVFLEALDGYRKLAVQELEQSLDNAKKGRKIQRTLTLTEPQDMTKVYDQVIQMLELTTEDIIPITFHEFQNYVRDEWQWTKQWSASNVAYASTQPARAYLLAKSAGGEEF